MGDPLERDHALIAVTTIDPPKPIALEVKLVERRLAAIKQIQIADPALASLMLLAGEQSPIERPIMIPFLPLGELRSHKEKLFAWLCRHVPEEQSEVRELFPFVARHLIPERTFAIHDLVVRERQH